MRRLPGLVLIVLIALGARQWWNWRAVARSAIGDRYALLAQAHVDLAGFDQIELAHGEARAALRASERRLLPAAGRALAEAELVTRLGYLASRHGVTVQRVSARPDTARSGSGARITVEAEVAADTPSLLTLLGAMHRDSFALELLSLRVAATNPAAGPTEPERLEATMAIGGWYREESGAR